MKRTAGFERHGRSSTDPTYAAWLSMKARCKNPKCENYPNYGGRGISVCERWDKSFLNFLSDIGDRPSTGLSLERDNVNGNYEPGNCRWATNQEQAENKRNSLAVEVNGVKYTTLVNACKAFGISVSTARNRIERGQSIDEVFNTKPASRSERSSKSITFRGVEYPTIAALCAAYCVNRETYYRRLKANKTIEQALGV